jgi:hypothetical protein
LLRRLRASWARRQSESRRFRILGKLTRQDLATPRGWAQGLQICRCWIFVVHPFCENFWWTSFLLIKVGQIFVGGVMSLKRSVSKVRFGYPPASAERFFLY